jgi:hypothetical protein
LSSVSSLTSLHLVGCGKVTDEGVRTMSNLIALTSLNLCGCREVTDEGMRDVSKLITLTFLNFRSATRCPTWGCEL